MSDPPPSPPSPPSATRVISNNSIKERSVFVGVEERRGSLKKYHGM